MKMRRPLFAAAFGVVAIPLVAASIAYACSALASLSLTPSTGDVGATISGVGKGFSNSHGGAPSSEPVKLHFNSRTGPVLWEGRPDAAGTVAFTFSVPRVAAGSYTLIATQTNADGQPAPGTPARAQFTVAGPLADSVAAELAAPVQSTETAAPAAAPVAAPAPAPAPAPAARTATAPRVRTAPAAKPVVAAPAPVQVQAPAPAPEANTPPAPPAPAVTPAPVTPVAPATPVTSPARRSATVAAASSDHSPALAIGFVVVGLLLVVGAVAMVVAGRRSSRARAEARR
ncbi:MAG TPA: hypothetical protein VFJ85_01830 [Acidimicrobiales bacterium]|nr:hypothetical protein [Acidimicrobiales bacterium]